MKNPEFSDVADDLKGFGTLAGPAVDEHYRAQAQLDPNGEGVHFIVFCDSCGTKNRVTTSFQELTYGMLRVIPPGWKRAHGGLTPNVGCRTCQTILMLVIVPDECARLLRSGMSQNKVPEQQVRAWTQQIHAATRR